MTVPGAATGGTFGPGALMVGEEGPEVIFPSQRISVFPTQATSRLAQLSNFLENSAHQTPIYNTYNSEYNTYDNSQDDHSSTIIVDGRGQSDDNIAMDIKRFVMTRRS